MFLFSKHLPHPVRDAQCAQCAQRPTDNVHIFKLYAQVPSAVDSVALAEWPEPLGDDRGSDCTARRATARMRTRGKAVVQRERRHATTTQPTPRKHLRCREVVDARDQIAARGPDEKRIPISTRWKTSYGAAKRNI